MTPITQDQLHAMQTRVASGLKRGGPGVVPGIIPAPLPPNKPVIWKHERELHETFANWLNLNNVPFVHSRMDRKATTANGTPDFVLLKNGAGACIEFKVQKDALNHLSPEQVAWWDKCALNKVPYLCTNHVGEAIAFAKKELKL